MQRAFLAQSSPSASLCRCSIEIERTKGGTDGRHLFSSNSFTLLLKNSLVIPTHKFIGWKEFNSDGEWQLNVAPSEKKDDSSYLQLDSRRWRFISRKIEGNYPNWRQVVPGQGSFATTIEFDPESIDAVTQTIGRMPCDDAVTSAIGLERSAADTS